MEYDPIQGLVSAITRIEDKLDKHDDKFDIIAQTLQKLVAVDIELKGTKESLKFVWEEIKELKDNQMSDGCPAHKSFIAVRNEQLKSYEHVVEDCKDKYSKLVDRMTTIEEKPKKRVEAAIVEIIKLHEPIKL